MVATCMSDPLCLKRYHSTFRDLNRPTGQLLTTCSTRKGRCPQGKGISSLKGYVVDGNVLARFRYIVDAYYIDKCDVWVRRPARREPSQELPRLWKGRLANPMSPVPTMLSARKAANAPW